MLEISFCLGDWLFQSSNCVGDVGALFLVSILRSVFFFPLFRQSLHSLVPGNNPVWNSNTKCAWLQFVIFIFVFDDDDDDDDEIAYFTVRWKTRASFVYHIKNMR